MESLDSREAVLELVLEVLAEDEFRDGPSAGLVLQAYLRDSPEQLDQILDWAGRASGPRRSVRLVKGAYWDHELVQARQHGWPAPVFEVKADCDRNFEPLTGGCSGPSVGARRDRLAQPALGRPRDRGQPAAAARSATSSCRCSGGSATSSRTRSPPRLPGPYVLPGRRPRRRHGLPRPAPAREHEQRVVPARAGARDAARGAARRPIARRPDSPTAELSSSAGAPDRSAGRSAGSPAPPAAG